MNNMGYKIAAKRKEMGMTQIEFAEKLSVTRQTVSRWEAGTVMPDIDKIPDIATILGVSCDYLLKDDQEDQGNVAAAAPSKTVSKILESMSAFLNRYVGRCFRCVIRFGIPRLSSGK